MMEREEIHGPVLLSLTEADLDRLGIAPFGRRRQLCLGLEQLRAANRAGVELRAAHIVKERSLPIAAVRVPPLDGTAATEPPQAPAKDLPTVSEVNAVSFTGGGATDTTAVTALTTPRGGLNFVCDGGVVHLNSPPPPALEQQHQQQQQMQPPAVTMAHIAPKILVNACRLSAQALNSSGAASLTEKSKTTVPSHPVPGRLDGRVGWPQPPVMMMQPSPRGLVQQPVQYIPAGIARSTSAGVPANTLGGAVLARPAQTATNSTMARVPITSQQYTEEMSAMPAAFGQSGRL